MVTTVETVKVSDQIKELRDKIEVALLTRISASVQDATAAELRELIALYQELMNSDWYRKH